MLTFFRKIRQKLLSQNKVTRYLVYALGEIVLVVIGILLALQINTWNQNRLDRKQEQQLLAQLEIEYNKFGAIKQQDFYPKRNVKILPHFIELPKTRIG